MSDDRLDALFRCEHLGKTIAVKHCLRRREERKQVKHPRTLKIVVGESENGYCATACGQGRAIRASVRDVPAGHCARCGTAYVGAEAAAEPCEECDAARVYEGKAPARGFLPPKTVEVSTRIWAKDAPDAPIAPPKRQDVGLTSTQVAEAAARVRDALRAPTRVAAPPPGTKEAASPAASAEPPADPAPSARPQPTTSGGESAPVNTKPEPADPAEERTMPTGKRTTPCPGCGTLGSKHRRVDGKDCPERLKTKSASTAPKAAPKKPASAPRAAQPKRPKLRTLEDVASRRAAAAAPSIPELVAKRAEHLEAVEEIDQELRRQKALLDKALGAEAA